MLKDLSESKRNVKNIMEELVPNADQFPKVTGIKKAFKEMPHDPKVAFNLGASAVEAVELDRAPEVERLAEVADVTALMGVLRAEEGAKCGMMPEKVVEASVDRGEAHPPKAFLQRTTIMVLKASHPASKKLIEKKSSVRSGFGSVVRGSSKPFYSFKELAQLAWAELLEKMREVCSTVLPKFSMAEGDVSSVDIEAWATMKLAEVMTIEEEEAERMAEGPQSVPVGVSVEGEVAKGRIEAERAKMDGKGGEYRKKGNQQRNRVNSLIREQ